MLGGIIIIACVALAVGIVIGAFIRNRPHDQVMLGLIEDLDRQRRNGWRRSLPTPRNTKTPPLTRR